MTLEVFKRVFSFSAAVRFPSVRADDDEEEELQDPQIGLRTNCRKKYEAIQLAEKLAQCNARVRSKKKTKETCEEEYHDLIRFVDHCVAHDLFDYLK